MNLSQKLENILPLVQKPARYVGGEYGQIMKNKDEAEVRFALCFPDTYEIGMSNLGIRILYGVLNSLDYVWCERVFEPWRDMADKMRDNDIPLYALESMDPVRDFDIIGFSVGYEMSYAGILDMLSLSDVPLRSSDREGLTPLVFAGGTCMFNPEPIADFIDLAVIGEGEEVDVEVVELYRQAKREGWSKAKFLAEASKIDGVYVPSLYNHIYNTDGMLKEIIPLEGAPRTVVKRIVKDLDSSYFPEHTIIPSTEIVHDRSVLEVFRGCIRGCRFCQAGYVYRPVRSKKPETLIKQGIESLKYSGYEEISLSSLSTSDYGGLNQLTDGLLDWCEPRRMSLSLPSLRADNFSMEIMKKVQKVRKSGLTFAPEAGSQRLRDVINKNVTEEDIINSCATAFEGGWSSVKLYFMLGLPTETDEDVLAISDLAYKVLNIWKKVSPNKARGVKITVSTSCFVPKPLTPFQWCPQNTMEEFDRKQNLLKHALKSKAITYNWHSPDVSLIEAVLALGDRRLSKVLEDVFKASGGLKAWNEYFDFNAWLDAFNRNGLDPAIYALREKGSDEALPWDTISAGVSKEFLRRQYELAMEGRTSPDCRECCLGCGANSLTCGGVCEVAK
jgi:radical SAM family uncharacterized protein